MLVRQGNKASQRDLNFAPFSPGLQPWEPAVKSDFGTFPSCSLYCAQRQPRNPFANLWPHQGASFWVVPRVETWLKSWALSTTRRHGWRHRNSEEHRLEAYATLGARSFERCLKGYFTGEIYGTDSDPRWASIAQASSLCSVLTLGRRVWESNMVPAK